MKVKAIKSFIGKVSMNIDDEREIIDKELAKELINAGHVIEIKENKIKEVINKEKKKTSNKKK